MGWKDAPIIQPASPMTHTQGRWASAPIVQPEPEPDPTRPEISGGQALGRGAVQGATLSFGDEINGLIQALGEKYLPESLGGGGEQASRRGLGDLYRQNRDTFRRENEDAEKQHKWKYIGGNVVGGVAPAVLVPALAKKLGTSALSGLSLGAAVKGGAVLGAAAGLGGSKADLSDGVTASDVGETGFDTVAGGLLGAGAGALGHGIGKAAPMLLRGGRRMGEWVAEKTGRRALLAGADSLSKKDAIPADVVLEAVKSGGIVPFGTTTGAFKRLKVKAETAGKVYGEIVDELHRMGVEGPDVDTIAKRLLSEAREAGPNTLDDRIPKAFMKARRLVRAKAGGDKLELPQAESLKRSAQDQAFYGRVEDTPLNNAHKRIAAILRRANEESIEAAGAANPGTQIAEHAESFIPVKNKLGRLIEARDAAKRGAARASQRSTFGLPDYLAALGGLQSTGDPMSAMLMGAGMSALRSRGPSTAASLSYWLGQGSGKLGNALERVPARALMGGRAGASLERAEAEDLFDLLGIGDDDEARRSLLRALGAAP